MNKVVTIQDILDDYQHPQNERKGFLILLKELDATKNPVTRAVLRDILKSRLDNNDIT